MVAVRASTISISPAVDRRTIATPEQIGRQASTSAVRVTPPTQTGTAHQRRCLRHGRTFRPAPSGPQHPSPAFSTPIPNLPHALRATTRLAMRPPGDSHKYRCRHRIFNRFIRNIRRPRVLTITTDRRSRTSPRQAHLSGGSQPYGCARPRQSGPVPVPPPQAHRRTTYDIRARVFSTTSTARLSRCPHRSLPATNQWRAPASGPTFISGPQYRRLTCPSKANLPSPTNSPTISSHDTDKSAKSPVTPTAGNLAATRVSGHAAGSCRQSTCGLPAAPTGIQSPPARKVHHRHPARAARRATAPPQAHRHSKPPVAHPNSAAA